MKKKLFMFSILTVLLFILSAIPVLADDAGDFKVDKTGNFKYELSEVGLKITSYEGSEKDVVIPNEIDGYKVSAIGKHAFKDNTTMTSVVIPEGVSNIYMEAFYGCSALSRIEFNAKNCTVTGVNTYSGNTGAGVFSGAGSASPNGLEVIFGDKVTKVPENLFDTASLDEGGHSGHPYAYVTSVTISESVKSIEARAFCGCRDLETVTFGGKEQTIGAWAFNGCGIKELNLGDALTSISEYAFFDNKSLETINWGGNLDNIGAYAFSKCTALTDVTFVNPLTTIGKGGFSECTALKQIVFPETLTGLSAEAFYGCINLNHITVNSKNLTVASVNTYSGSNGAGVFSGAGSGSATGLEVVFGAKAAKVPDSMFDTASLDGGGHSGHPYAYVTSVTFENGVKEIGSWAFRNCQALETISFGESVQKIGEQSFRDCSALTELVFNKELSSIGDSAFTNNTGLEKIIWGEKLDNIGPYAFHGCTSLTKVHFINPLTTIQKGAFSDCTALRQVILPESLTTLGGEAFYGCIGLNQLIVQSINLSTPGVNTYSDAAGAGAFSGAGSGSPTGLEVTFYTGVKTVPANMFDTASLDGGGHSGHEYAYVTSIVCASSVTEVGDCAFRSCQSLEKIHFYSKDVTFGEKVFDNCLNPSFHIEGPSNGTLQTSCGEKNVTFSNNREVEAMPEIEEPEKAQPAPGSNTNQGSTADQTNTADQGSTANQGSTTSTSGAPDTDSTADTDTTWTCSNGHAGNTGNFCPQCGEKKPE